LNNNWPSTTVIYLGWFLAIKTAWS